MKRKNCKIRFVLLFVAALLLQFSWAEPKVNLCGYADFEIVESAPIETVLDNPHIRNAYEVWLEMISKATASLDIEEFYISNAPSEPLEDIIQAIIAAGDRGVKVRIISDASFYKTYPETLDRLKKEKNIQVRTIDFKKIPYGGGVMHAKYFIVDNQSVFVGSQNFDWRALKHIREVGFRINNRDLARIFQDLFEFDWRLAELTSKDVVSESDLKKLINKTASKKHYSIPIKMTCAENEIVEFYPVYSPINLILDTTLWDEKHIVELIDSAKSEVLIQLLTYSPVSKDGLYYAELDNALRRAAVRGVKVKLIISDWAKRKPQIYHLKSLSVIPNIEVKLSTIPQWSGGYIPYARVEHCKYLVVDNDKCWLGSSNWERSYFYDSRNVGIVVKNKKLAECLRQFFFSSWNSPYTYFLKPEVEYQPPKIGE